MMRKFGRSFDSVASASKTPVEAAKIDTILSKCFILFYVLEIKLFV